MEKNNLRDVFFAFMLGVTFTVFVLSYPLLFGYYTVALLVAVYGLLYKVTSRRLFFLCFLFGFFYSALTGFFPSQYELTGTILFFKIEGTGSLSPFFALLYVLRYALHVVMGTLVLGFVVFVESLPVFYFFLWLLLRRNAGGRRILEERIKWSRERDEVVSRSLCVGVFGLFLLILSLFFMQYVHPVFFFVFLLVPSAFFVYLKSRYDNIGYFLGSLLVFGFLIGFFVVVGLFFPHSEGLPPYRLVVQALMYSGMGRVFAWELLLLLVFFSGFLLTPFVFFLCLLLSLPGVVFYVVLKRVGGVS
ncbi:MAG: hypothetical protein JW778_04660 [Candidatus Altiarchaeota archaeon]|nr:hypothetical protein [Candidatus Altiarchaeota archaeon]